jgi:lysine N6-hydroxylase
MNIACSCDKGISALRCDKGQGRIFIQNAEIFQQGVGSPDLGIGATRHILFWQTIVLERRLFRNSISITPQ